MASYPSCYTVNQKPSPFLLMDHISDSLSYQKTHVSFSFFVQEIQDQETLQKISLTVHRWIDEASALAEVASRQNLPIADQYYSCEGIAKLLAEDIQNPDFQNRMYCQCMDDHATTHGLMILSRSRNLKNRLKIELLVKDPKDIRNDIHGIGSRLFRYAEEYAFQQRFHGLVLKSYESSKTFYEYQGCMEDPAQGPRYMIKDFQVTPIAPPPKFTCNIL